MFAVNGTVRCVAGWLLPFAATLLIRCTSAACQPSAQPDAAGRLVPVAEMNSDLDFLCGTLDDVHPDPYQNISKRDLADAKTKLVASLKEPVGERRCYRLVAGLLAQVGDGHTNVLQAPDAWRSYLANGGLVFPLEVSYSDGVLRVVPSNSDHTEVGAGDTIVSIDGHEAKALFDSMLTEVSGERRSYRVAVVEQFFVRFLWAHDISSPYEIDYASHLESKRASIKMDGITNKTRTERLKQFDASSKPYSYRELSGGIGDLDFRSMSGERAAFREFLDVTFRDARDHAVKGLIVDLRQNSGGDSSVGEELLSYITDKPYKMADRKEWRVSQEYKDFLREASTDASASKYLNTPVGETVTYAGKITKPRDNSLRFKGAVCFLIGPRTFSSAVMLANAVGDFKLATLIGEETGGTPNEFGEIYTFKLPSSGIVVNVSSARWVRANGDAKDRHGVLPDILVETTAEDRARGVDAVLERAIEWISKSQSRAARAVRK
jgi:hypothetical protein